MHDSIDSLAQRAGIFLLDVLHQIWFTLKGLLIAVLPYPENQRLAWAWGLDAAAYSLLLGIIETTLGLGLFFFGAIQAVQGGSLFFSQLLLDNWFPELNTQHFQGGGIIALMTWLIHPLAWLFILVALTGAARLFAYVASQQPVGEPFVWALLRLVQHSSRLARRAKQARDLGPLRHDHLRFHAGCDLEITTCRERPTWSEGATLEVQGRFFRPLGPPHKTSEGPHWALVYRFYELDDNSVIRGLVHYSDALDGEQTSEPPDTL